MVVYEEECVEVSESVSGYVSIVTPKQVGEYMDAVASEYLVSDQYEYSKSIIASRLW